MRYVCRVTLARQGGMLSVRELDAVGELTRLLEGKADVTLRYVVRGDSVEAFVEISFEDEQREAVDDAIRRVGLACSEA